MAVETNGRNRANVFTGAPDVSISGGFFIGPAALDPEKYPKKPDEDLKALATTLGLTSAGYITKDGTKKNESRSTEKIQDWNLDVIDIVETEYGLQLTTTFAEAANGAVLKAIYGAENVHVEDGFVHIAEGSRVQDDIAILYAIRGKGGKRGLGFAPVAQISSIGEISMTKSSLIQYECTIDVLSGLDGKYMHTWLATGAVKAPASSGAPAGVPGEAS